MPLILPPGAVITPNEVSGWNNGRVSRFRFDLLDNNESQIGVLTSVVPGGSISFDAYASVKSGGTIDLIDLGDDVDWLNVRVRPTAVLQNVGGPVAEEPCGIYLCAAPTAKYDATGKRWSVELMDKLSILDTDVAGASGGDKPSTFTVPVGSNVVEVVKAIIEETGESSAAISPGSKQLNTSITWDATATRLQVINDLLDAINYFSLFCDRWGQFRAEPYIAPGQRAPVYEIEAPFTKGPTSLMSPEWDHDKDIYGIPNRFIAMTPGTGETEAMYAVAVNNDLSSPYSYQNRGNRWITQTDPGVEASTQEDLDAIAVRRLSAATSVTESFAVSHLYLPDLVMNSVVRFVNSDAGLDTIASCISTEIVFDPTALCKTNLREVGR